MVVIEAAGQAIADVDAAFPQALADAGEDPRLLALVHYQLAWRSLVVQGDFAQGREEAAHAARLAAEAADRRTELLALAFQAQAETLMGIRTPRRPSGGPWRSRRTRGSPAITTGPAPPGSGGW